MAPETLQLAFSNGQCQQVILVDDGGLQQLTLTPTATTEFAASSTRIPRPQING